MPLKDVGFEFTHLPFPHLPQVSSPRLGMCGCTLGIGAFPLDEGENRSPPLVARYPVLTGRGGSHGPDRTRPLHSRN